MYFVFQIYIYFSLFCQYIIIYASIDYVICFFKHKTVIFSVKFYNNNQNLILNYNINLEEKKSCLLFITSRVDHFLILIYQPKNVSFHFFFYSIKKCNSFTINLFIKKLIACILLQLPKVIFIIN